MKAIMLSVRPEWVAKILNGEKTIEIRKSVPKDFKGWVYIYCTKGRRALYDKRFANGELNIYKAYFLDDYGYTKPPVLNGKIVARFWLDEWEEISNEPSYHDNWFKYKEKTCVSFQEWFDYFTWSKNGGGYAWHIEDLVIFDTPKELSEFNMPFSIKKYRWDNKRGRVYDVPLTKAPQSWQYIEVTE